MNKVKKRAVAGSFQSESGDDYIFVFKAGPKTWAKMVAKAAGDEAGYLRLRCVSALDGEDVSAYRAAVVDKVGFEVC